MRPLAKLLIPGVITCLLISCQTTTVSPRKSGITKQSFGFLPDSTEISMFTLKNASGVEMKVIDYGGIITSLSMPDRNGSIVDVVLGFDNLAGYLGDSPYFGALIGRYGNRIAGGKFNLNGSTYTLAKNNGENHLHGGIKGFDKVAWKVKELVSDTAVGLELHYLSPDGEEGYPGNLDVTVSYYLTHSNELIFSYKAETDKETPVNLTQHTYFNLSGKGDIRSHELMIDADRYTVVDSTLIPTGELRPVKGTAFDFTISKPIGRDLAMAGGNPVGYDHNFVLNKPGLAQPVARLYSQATGISMDIFTDQPGIQFYSGNFLDGSITGKSGIQYQQYNGLCLETQHFPDSPNQPSFPSTWLKPGETYKTTTVYRFRIVK